MKLVKIKHFYFPRIAILLFVKAGIHCLKCEFLGYQSAVVKKKVILESNVNPAVRK